MKVPTVENMITKERIFVPDRINMTLRKKAVKEQKPGERLL